MSEYRPENGDRVRVVYEGVAESSDAEGFYVAQGVPVFYEDKGLVSIEKVEPPVVTFKPGDTVRNRDTGSLLTLGRKGFLNHSTANFHQYGKYDPSIRGNGSRYSRLDQFTSDKYELVAL